MAEIIERPSLRVTRAAPLAQIALHCAPEDAPALADAIGVVLTAEMLRAAASGDWNALHLAPDEWLLTGPLDQGEALLARLAEAASIAKSVVAVSDRSLAIELHGTDAAALLNAGCPLDLSDTAFPRDACTRTLFGKVQVLVWRMSKPDCFRMQYGRSYDDYVTALIVEAAQDLPERVPN